LLHKNIKKLYFSKVFHNLIFAYVIERLFWQSRGMTAMMVVYTEIVYAAVITIFEIPTGILADKLSKKKMLLIADVLSVLEFVILIYAYNFQSFALAVSVAGISTCLRSGTERALLYESLKANKNQSLFEKYLGRLNAFDFAAAFAAALLGSFFANRVGLEINYYLSAVSLIIAMIITSTLEDVNYEKPGRLKANIIKKSIYTLKLKPILWLIVASFCFLSAVIVYADEFWQLYLDDLSISVLYFGLYSILASLLRMPGSLIAYKLLKHIKHLTFILWLLVLMILFLLFSFIFSGYAGIIFLLLAFMLDGLVEPVIMGFLHHNIPSEVRATMDSFLSLVMRFVNIPVGLGFGYFAAGISIQAAFGYLSAVLFAYFLIYLVIYIRIRIN